MKRLFSFLILFSLITLMFFQSCGERSVEEEVIIRSIGDPYQGGIIAYLLKSDDAGYEGSQQHGLIVALEDQGGMDVLWWNEVLGDLETKALGNLIGDGLSNTELIVSVQGEGVYAAKICMDYEIAENEVVYDDWFLPSKGELAEIYENIDELGEFKTTYWSSTEAERNQGAWRQNLFNSAQNVSKKYEPYSVRPIRSF
ncbi:MAG: hypothetical protein QMB12_02155 [Cyclobacteriaceae bacterium]|jgi:hypothetical protein|tara:strand:- start:455 stop:1051 length:597 start_codon:yes stop_codon:yes gene_type:complete